MIRYVMLGALGLVQLFVASASGSSERPYTGEPFTPSVERVVERYYAKVEQRLEPRFRYADVAWPPRQVSLVAFKEQRRLEVWARQDDDWVFIHHYPIRGLSGELGPKLREGDRQVPEGFYRITWLNPHSNYHLSMKLDYPNVYDREQARNEGRGQLGGDIFIHGRTASRGCLAMGDSAIEDLFVLTALIGKENVSVVISPRDFRVEPLGLHSDWQHQADWVAELNRDIAAALEKYPLESR